jgi:integrase
MAGWERGLIYRLAAESGLRHGEIYGLLKRDFDFDARLINVRAACAKNARNDQIPLRPELAEALRDYMADFPMTAKAFPRLWKGQGAKMLHID